MPQVRLSQRAQADLSRLYAFIASKIGAAQRAVLAIREAFVPLRHAPTIGRLVEDSNELREIVIDFGASGYLALYRFEPALDAVTVLAIKHQSEDDYK